MEQPLEHEGIRQVDLDRVQQIIRLRVVNAKLLAALEELVSWLGKRPAGIHPEAMIEYTRALDVIQEAKK